MRSLPPPTVEHYEMSASWWSWLKCQATTTLGTARTVKSLHKSSKLHWVLISGLVTIKIQISVGKNSKKLKSRSQASLESCSSKQIKAFIQMAKRIEWTLCHNECCSAPSPCLFPTCDLCERHTFAKHKTDFDSPGGRCKQPLPVPGTVHNMN